MQKTNKSQILSTKVNILDFDIDYWNLFGKLVSCFLVIPFMAKFVKIIVFVPVESADKIRKVLGDNGAGKLGNYSYSSFSFRGKGRFKPEAGSNPTIGKIGELTETDEERIEVIAPIEKYLDIVEKVKQSHPYEEPAIEVYDLLYP